jgi:hypothetical protein
MLRGEVWGVIMKIALSLAPLLIGFLVALITRNLDTGIIVAGTIGLALLLLAAIISGSLVSGDRTRANYTNNDDYRNRQNLAATILLIGLPSLLIGIAYYFVIR